MKLIILHGYNKGLKSILPYTKILKKHNPDLDIILPISSSKRWYDIFQITPYIENNHIHFHEDNDGIKFTTSKIFEIIDDLVESGTNCNDIVIMGFSQGGAISAYVGLTYKYSLKAIIGICAYVPLILNPEEEVKFNKDRKIFLLNGINDKLIKPEYIDYLSQRYPYVQSKFYNCNHEICNEMIEDIKTIISY